MGRTWRAIVSRSFDHKPVEVSEMGEDQRPGSACPCQLQGAVAEGFKGFQGLAPLAARHLHLERRRPWPPSPALAELAVRPQSTLSPVLSNVMIPAVPCRQCRCTVKRQHSASVLMQTT